MLDGATLPDGLDRRATAAIFMAVLGRMTEPTAVPPPRDDADRTAALMVHLLQRSLLRSHAD
ncbi:hypothetical protein [Mycobacterium marseillense]|uniref:hypothetical protein n=1 Tax=Mycobacterium marseillense TaxID=701042 RepID=UPI0011A2F844|nr:hypothetical protein [Mycobacterium marseillense]